MAAATFSARAPLLVGVVILLAAGGLSFFYAKTGADPYSDSKTIELSADFIDASGLRPKTRVQINGLDAGRVSYVEHARDAAGRPVAKVHIRVGKQFDIHDDAVLRKATESLLGDFRLDLEPGHASAPQLGHRGVIKHIHSRSDIDEIKGELLQVAKNVNEMTGSLARVIAGPQGESSLQTILKRVESAITSIDHSARMLEGVMSDNDGVIRGIIGHVGDIAGQMAYVTRPGGEMVNMATHLAAVSAKLDRMADSLGSFVNADEEGEGGSMRSSLKDISEGLHHVKEITRKIDDGSGTIGRVINDPAIADKVESTLDSAGALIGNISTLETLIELRSEYGWPISNPAQLQTQKAIKNTVGLRIAPKPDKYYLFEAIADPRGRQTRALTTTQLGGSGADAAVVTADTTTIAFNDLKFSAQFAKRYFFTTLRFGIIENTGGLGVNLHALRDRAEVRFDAFAFDRRDINSSLPIQPRLRGTAIWQLANHVHLQLGIDDPFTNLRTLFLGGILRFTDEDLKGLLVVAPKI